MIIDEAIKHCKDCVKEYTQLSHWLEELKSHRASDAKITQNIENEGITTSQALDILENPQDYTYPRMCEAIDVAIEALRKQIEIENSQFTHICKSDNDYYPTTFTIYARVVEDGDKSVTLDRFQKFGALPLKRITISREDFERYYKPIAD